MAPVIGITSSVASQWEAPLRDCAATGFMAAYLRRPDAYLDAGVRASISALALLDAAVISPAIARLDADLRSGACTRSMRICSNSTSSTWVIGC